MIDLRIEQLRLLSKAAADVPGRPHSSTLMRWWRRGVKGVKLETVVVGGRRFTSIEAIQRFIEALSAPHSTQGSPVRQLSHRQIALADHRRSTQIDEELDAAGI